jgi:hypothetical protein
VGAYYFGPGVQPGGLREANLGDRVSISFQGKLSEDWTEESPALFSHWRGMGFVEEATEYLKNLKAEAKKEGESLPLYRLEPATVMLDFIRHIASKEKRITNDLYICKSQEEGDNSDNGHWTINLQAGKATQGKMKKEDICLICGEANYSKGPHYMGVCGKCLAKMINKEIDKQHPQRLTLTQIEEALRED